MKKAIKNYLTKLRENEEKGFSLVELIIVMAIMAILVGVVASQVIPYMEKSRQSKDQQQLSSVGTTLVSAIAQNPDTYDQSTSGSSTAFSISDLATKTSNEVAITFCELMGERNVTSSNVSTTLATIKSNYVGNSAKKIGSKEGKEATDLEITLETDGKVTVKLAGTSSSKLNITTE